MTLKERIKAARQAGVPLLCVTTMDPAACEASIVETLNSDTPKITWDLGRKARAINAAGKVALDELAGGNLIEQVTADPREFLGMVGKLPAKSTVFIHGIHLLLDDAITQQSVWNLRDALKTVGSRLVMLCPSVTLPPMLQQDVLLLDDPPPTEEELDTMASALHKAAKFPEPKAEEQARVVEGLRGCLSLFAAEQALAQAFDPVKKKASLDMLWELKRSLIESVPGLSVDRERYSFDEVGGMNSAKSMGRALINGRVRPSLVVRIDEIEKSLTGAGSAGLGSDTSGVSGDQLGVLLRNMEDNEWSGMIAVGPAGSGKTLFSTCLGATGDIPSIAVDLGATKNKWVGGSEKRVRALFKTILGMGGKGKVFFVATCNRLEALPPELRRRFKMGTWYFDLPTDDEKSLIWPIHLRKRGLDLKMKRPDDRGWTGAEIRNCCEMAWNLSIPLVKAADYIVPVAKADPERVRQLRSLANGRFLSAATPGVYRMPDDMAPAAAGSRTFG